MKTTHELLEAAAKLLEKHSWNVTANGVRDAMTHNVPEAWDASVCAAKIRLLKEKP